MALDLSLTAMGDPSRRRILELLARGARTVSEIQAHFTFSQPALSKHLRVLREAGLVSFSKEGRTHVYRINGAALVDAADWMLELHRFWSTQLDNLGEVLKKVAAEESVGDEETAKRR